MFSGTGADCSLECWSWVKEILLGKRAKDEKGEGMKATASPFFLNPSHWAYTWDWISACICHMLGSLIMSANAWDACMSNRMYQLLANQLAVSNQVWSVPQSSVTARVQQNPLEVGKEHVAYHNWGSLPDAHCNLQGGKEAEFGLDLNVHWKGQRGNAKELRWLFCPLNTALHWHAGNPDLSYHMIPGSNLSSSCFFIFCSSVCAVVHDVKVGTTAVTIKLFWGRVSEI